MSEQKLTPEQRQKILRLLKFGPKMGRKELGKYALRMYRKVTQRNGEGPQ